jgi:hypothetical protein
MSTNEWAGIAVAVTTIIASFAGSVRWLVKHYLNELKPNGGGSIRDAVTINTERLNRVETRIDDIYRLICERPIN